MLAYIHPISGDLESPDNSLPGFQPGGGRPDNSLPGGRPGLPDNTLPPLPGIWPPPGQPTLPIHIPPGGIATPPIYIPGSPEKPINLPPGIYPPLPPSAGIEGKVAILVWVVGVGNRWVVYDTGVEAGHPLPPHPEPK